MRALLLAIAVAFAAGCSSSPGTCTNLVHAGCDLDGGSGCAAHQACVSAGDAVDPCVPDAGGCCFQVCTQDADCSDGLVCIQGSCAQGRCVQ